MTGRREIPILMSAPMIRALQAGIKDQTRRIMNPQPDFLQYHTWNGELIYEGENRVWCWKEHTFDNLWDMYICEPARAFLAALAPVKVGDILWVRETWQALHPSIDPETGYADDISYSRRIPRDSQDGWWKAAYAADPAWPKETIEDRGFPWRPGIFMPRWASRFTLECTEVRVQPVQEISEDDARAEGVRIPDAATAKQDTVDVHGMTPYRAAFAALWEQINGKRRRREYLQVGDPGYTVERPWRTVVDDAFGWNRNPWVYAYTFRQLETP